MMRSHQSSPPLVVAALRVLVVIIGCCCAPLHVAADLLALAVSSDTAPPGALAKAQADAATLLQKFSSYEGPSYGTIMAPGQTATIDGGGAVRKLMLRGGVDEEEDEEDASSSSNHQDRQLFDCPNSCSNSGSVYCQILGCAYCGRCRRLQYATTTTSFSTTSTNKHRKIEAQLSTYLTNNYCQGNSGCVITASILRVNGDGTMSTAV